MIADLFLTLAEAISPAKAPTPPPVPSTPPAIERRVEPAEKQPAARLKYRMPDRAGQVWEHDDPGFLANWVAQRNAAMVTTYLPASARRCGPSGCR